jgi:hypothetical protein
MSNSVGRGKTATVSRPRMGTAPGDNPAYNDIIWFCYLYAGKIVNKLIIKWRLSREDFLYNNLNTKCIHQPTLPYW